MSAFQIESSFRSEDFRDARKENNLSLNDAYRLQKIGVALGLPRLIVRIGATGNSAGIEVDLYLQRGGDPALPIYTQLVNDKGSATDAVALALAVNTGDGMTAFRAFASASGLSSGTSLADDLIFAINRAPGLGQAIDETMDDLLRRAL